MSPTPALRQLTTLFQDNKMQKNPTILKDELSILKADKSAVLIEIENRGQELKEVNQEIEKAEKKLSDIQNETKLGTARRDDINARAILLSKKEARLTEKVKELKKKAEVERIKYSQETKLHLGRIRDIKTETEVLEERLSELKGTYDRNVLSMNQNLSDLNTKYRELGSQYTEKHKELQKVEKDLELLRNEDKRLTKERLKREDKIRNREKALERSEQALKKREEDVTAMANDLMVVYFRLKELYAKVDPNVDLEKIITKAT